MHEEVTSDAGGDAIVAGSGAAAHARNARVPGAQSLDFNC